MIAIPGYRISEEIGESNRTLVYRGYSEKEQKDIIIKVPVHSDMDYSDYEREYERLNKLDIKGIEKIFGIEVFKGGFALIVEDIGGASLNKLILAGFRVLKEQLQVAVEVTAILGRLHAGGIVHGEIKPSNVIVNTKTGDVRITGLNYSIRHAEGDYSNKDMLPDTLLYISPEQTGRMNRVPDYRTDFYSLGITFYEMFSGVLPFKSEDSVELIYSHIARIPETLHAVNADIPGILSDIVGKLMAKNPEDRYQSAFGIKYDLTKALNMLTEQGKMTAFRIAQKDISEKLNIPRKLYGREQEKAVLLESYQRAAEGSCEVVLISGSAGVGKTLLIEETLRPILSQGAFFAEGKYDRIHQNIPYSAVIQALRGLVRKLLTESGKNLAQWRSEFQAAFGLNGQIVLDVIPELEALTGPQPPVTVLSPAEAKNVFDMVFQSFLNLFMQKDNPLVIFLDDLQDADAASLQIMENVLTAEDSGHFLLAGTYRTEETGEGHPLHAFISNLAKKQIRTQQLPLGLLGIHEIESMVTDMLSSVAGKLHDLAGIVLEKTGGNAFFINEFISKIYRDKLLRFNSVDGRWEWDAGRIGDLSVTDNVLDLLVERLNRQPEEVREVLMLASCIADHFNCELLSQLRHTLVPETIHPVMAAVREGFLLPVRENEKAVSFKFLHDRIREASRTLLGTSDVRAVHLAIGRAILKNSKPEDREERLFEILSHFNQCIDLITDTGEKLAIASLSLSAGKKAGVAAAYLQACVFLETGLTMLPPDCWEKHYRLTFDLQHLLSDYLYMADRTEASEQLFQPLMDKAATDIDRGEICADRIKLYFNAGKIAESFDFGIKTLGMFGLHIDVRPDKVPEQIFAEIVKFNKNMSGMDIDDLYKLPLMSNEREIVKTKILLELGIAAYFSNQPLSILMIMIGLNINVLHGHSPSSPTAYIGYAMYLCTKREYEQAFLFGQLGLRLHEKIGSHLIDAKIYQTFQCFVNHWKRHAETNLALIEKAYQSGRTYGDIFYSGYATGFMIITQFFLGQKNLKTLTEESNSNMIFLKQTGNTIWYERLKVMRQTFITLTGDAKSPELFSMDYYHDEQQKLQDFKNIQYLLLVSQYYLNKMKALYLMGIYDDALVASCESEKFITYHSATVNVIDHYLYQALLYSVLYPLASDEKKEYYSAIIERNKIFFEERMKMCPENFECRYLLISAEAERIKQNDSAAMELYDLAIESAQNNRYPVIAAQANELAARYYIGKNREKVAAVYLSEALDGYRKWGADAKVKQMEDEHGNILRLLQKTRITLPSGNIEDRTSIKSSIAEMVDLASIIRATRVISGEIVFSSLVDKLMNILFANAGAVRGFMVIDDHDGVIVSASADGDRLNVSMNPLREQPSGTYPETVINYVRLTGENVTQNDAASEGLFIADTYIAANKPQSILCLPIVEQKKTAGILYLENTSVKNVFTLERVEILKLLSAQAAISIKNSLNYEEISRTKEELQVSRENLQDSLDEYKVLLNNIQDIFYRTDVDGKITMISPSVFKVSGYTPNEIIGRYLPEILYNPEDGNFFLRELRKNEFVENFEVRLVKKDGSCIWVSANSHFYRDKKGYIVGVEGIVRDISSRKHYEEMLLDEKERLSVMLKSIGDGVIATDTDGNVLLINKVAEELTGWDKNDAVGHPLGEVFHIVYEQTRERRAYPVKRILDGTLVSLSERILLISKNGSERMIADNAAPIRDMESRVIGAIIVFRDVTEKLKLEAEVLKNQKLESLGIFAGGIAHDFNNFLTGILGNISLAKLDLKNEERVTNKLNDAEKASLRAKNLTQQLLTFSKGGVPLKKIISILDMLKDSANFVLSGSNIKSEFDLPDGIWPIDADEGQINQVINNLIINSMQAMPDGGKIAISASNIYLESESRLPLPGGKYVMISVSDEGIGIPEDKISFIFDPFFTTKPTGNGLGLSTSYSIIKKHEGHIECESQIGKGTTFRIYLPASEKFKEDKRDDQNQFESHLPKGRVLMMDDDDMILGVGGDMLASLGYDVVKVHDGNELIEEFCVAKDAGKPYCAVIMDLTIPGGMGGREAIIKLKEIDPDIKCIVSSGYSNDPVMSAYGRYGFSGFIIKPYRFEEMKKAMRSIE